MAIFYATLDGRVVSTFNRIGYPDLTGWILATVLEYLPRATDNKDGSWIAGAHVLRFYGQYRGPQGKIEIDAIRLDGSFVR